MVNPAALMKLMGAKKKFDQNHPKVSAYFQAIQGIGMQEGTVIELTITPPGGQPMTTNMRVTADDLALIEDLKSLGNQQ